MKTASDLRRAIRSIDGRGYPACKSLAGAWRLDGFALVVDHVQGDPFAAPSNVHVEVPPATAGFPRELRSDACRVRALADFLARRFAKALERYSHRAKGSGKSGLLCGSRCGQEVLSRSACEIDEDGAVTARFTAGFPAFGRSINAEGLERMLLEFVPACVREALMFENLDARAVGDAVALALDQRELRRQMREEGIVAFVADGSILPRESGVSDRPMPGAVPFSSPETLRRTFELPNAGEVSGMALPAGVTLIVGGGYHGKTTLLEALQAGVYDHIAGDGREFVCADDTAVKLRAEDGRAVRGDDISSFIRDLPNGRDTASFSTDDASGSTSQAAAVVEGLEAGTRLFLIDEDTSAANFMVRDELMQQVVARDREPITPFVERVRDLFDNAGASTVLVAGSSGAFFYVADTVVQMDAYRPIDITERVREVCAAHPRQADDIPPFRMPSFDRAFPKFSAGGKGKGGGGGRGERRGGRGRGGRGDARHEHLKVRTFGCDTVSVGGADIDVRYLEQLVDAEQTAALGQIVRFCLERLADGTRTYDEVARGVCEALARDGWRAVCPGAVPCGLALPRPNEIAACLNRYRG